MIADECQSLLKQLEKVAKAEELEKIHEQLETKRNDLTSVRDSLVAVTNCLKALSHRTELAINLNPTKCLHQVHKIRQALETEPLSITKGTQFKSMTNAYEKFTAEGYECAQKTWEHYMPRQKPSVDMNQLAQAEQQSSFKTTVSKLKTHVRQADKMGSKPPETENEFLDLESIWQDIRTMMEKLPDVADDPLVQEFLKATNSPGGAPIDLLTDDVRAWLADNNIASKYRITTM